MTGWISVADKLPESVDDYLVWCVSSGGFSNYMDVLTFLDGRFRGEPCGMHVTHWMRLLKTPQEPQ